ncbi:cupin [Capsulimonas corticalis]|uniref:Cupin n=1 Tax=Capsulimonas corticalis TaxID=2219043 RepID=A0A402CTG7_9BACT|nr:cupin domain-containing protein [Capsulimonas corticalis]BDI30745.1 cupin [Capsulimonas corticalis]
MMDKQTQSPATKHGASEYFTGTAWLDEVITTPIEMGVSVFRVTFEPGARTAWHTHPVGQILVVESGVGRAQILGEPVREIHAGESVYFAAGVKHWHGAAPDRIMVHLAIQRVDEAGHYIEWREHVSDAEYVV